MSPTMLVTDFGKVQHMINQSFVTHELQAYTYVNREEDLGLPGLRKSKMSYVPDILYKKGIIQLAEI